MNTSFPKSTSAGIVLLLVMQILKAQTIPDIDDIKINQNPANPAVYEFIPMSGGSPLTSTQLGYFLWEWEFSYGDNTYIEYSVERSPRLSFPRNGSLSVTLRMTGIKQVDDPDERTISEISPPSLWTRTIQPIKKQVDVTGSMTSTTPTARIHSPAHLPIPLDSFSVPIIFENPTDCKAQFTVGLTTNAPHIVPLICHRHGNFGEIDCNNPNPTDAMLEYTFLVPAKTRVAVLPRFLTHDHIVSGQSITLTMDSEYRLLGERCNSKPQKLMDQRTYTVLRTKDPNKKLLLNGPMLSPGEVAHYSIRIYNVVDSPERYILIRDRFDPRFDSQNVIVEEVLVHPEGNSATINIPRKDLISGVKDGYQYTIKDGLLEMTVAFGQNLSGAPSTTLDRGGYLEVKIAAPIQKDGFTSLSDSCGSKRKPCECIPNTVETLFGSEGVWYSTESNPVLCVQIGPTPTGGGSGFPAWILAAIAAIAVVIVILMVMRRQR